jgi:hypothetical protein
MIKLSKRGMRVYYSGQPVGFECVKPPFPPSNFPTGRMAYL